MVSCTTSVDFDTLTEDCRYAIHASGNLNSPMPNTGGVLFVEKMPSSGVVRQQFISDFGHVYTKIGEDDWTTRTSIIQGGDLALTITGAGWHQFTVVFPQSFSTSETPPIVMVTQYDSGDNSSHIQTRNITTTQFGFDIYSTYTGTWTQKYQYIAIGGYIK